MERNLNQASATVLVLGSILFLVAALLPVSFRVFPETSPVKKLETITADPGQWVAAQVLFALGAVITVVGFALYAYYGRQESFAGLAWTSAVLLAVGAMPWLWTVHARAVDPAWFAEGSFPRWPFLIYCIATEAGLAIFGVALLSSSLPTWVGWIVIVSMVLLAILTLVFRDMVPAVFYVITLLVGLMLFR